MKHSYELITKLVLWALLLTGLGFHQASLAAGEPGRKELDDIGSKARATLIEHRPDLSEKLDGLPGYAVIAMSTTKIPGIGTGLGYGVIYDNRSSDRSYIKVTQFEVGGGMGAQKFKVIILFKDDAPLDRLIKGGLRYESGADVASKIDQTEATAPVPARSGKGYRVFRLDESGVLASITLRLLHGKPYLSE